MTIHETIIVRPLVRWLALLILQVYGMDHRGT
jgi:hypothetical protein